MLISIAGVGLISFGDSKALETGLLGDVIIFCTVWLWAVYSILVKKIDDFGFPGFAVTRRIFFYALVVMIVPISLTADVSVSDFTVSSIANLLYLGVLASALCFYTWNRAVARLGTITASKYLFIMPIITFFAQLVYNKSVVGVASTIGMATILLGLFISEQKSGDVIEEK